MQELKLTQEDDFDTKFLFLYELINTFTKELNIKNRLFYFRINKALRQHIILSSLSYNEQGLLFFERIFKDYRMLKRFGKGLYQIAPYFKALTKLLTLIYEEAARHFGEIETKKILRSSFNLAKKKYKKIPDLEGYVPIEMPRKLRKLKLASFSANLVENMIKYLVEDIIKKDIKAEKIAAEAKKIKMPEQAEEPIEEEITKFFGKEE